MSHKSVLQDATRECGKSVLQECPTRVPYGITKMSYRKHPFKGLSRKSAKQKCRTRVLYKSVLEECNPRMSLESVKQEYLSNNVWPFVFPRLCAFRFVSLIHLRFRVRRCLEGLLRARCPKGPQAHVATGKEDSKQGRSQAATEKNISERILGKGHHENCCHGCLH